MSQIFRAQKSPRGAGLGGNSFMFLTAVVVFRPKAVFSTHPFNGINTREGLFPEQLHEQGVRVCGVH